VPFILAHPAAVLGGLVLLARLGPVAPRGNDWPSHDRISRSKFRIFVGLAAVVGAAWSLSDPVSQASLHDWLRCLLLGVIQGTCAGLAAHAVLRGFKQSRHDGR